jgi:protein phosphatase
MIPPQPPLGFRVGKHSQKGTRAGKIQNEDTIDHFPSPFGDVLIVADGMGGHGHGDLASAIVVSSFRDTMPASASLGVEEAMRYSLKIAHSRILQAVEQNGLKRGVGSTVVVAVIAGNVVHLGHVGDSRCYLYHQEELIQITRDHSLVQTEIDAGRLTEEQALLDSRANTLTHAVGATDNVELELNEPIYLEDGDAILLCSDGVHGYMDRTGILYGLKQNLHDPQRVAESLVSMAANTCNSDDDISVIFAQYGAPVIRKAAPIFTKGRSEELQARRNAAAPLRAETPAASGETPPLVVTPSLEKTVELSAISKPPAQELPPARPRDIEDDDDDFGRPARTPIWMIALLLFAGGLMGGAAYYGGQRVLPKITAWLNGSTDTQQKDGRKDEKKTSVVKKQTEEKNDKPDTKKTGQDATHPKATPPAPAPKADAPRKVGIIATKDQFIKKAADILEKLKKGKKAADPSKPLKFVELHLSPISGSLTGHGKEATVVLNPKFEDELKSELEKDLDSNTQWKDEWNDFYAVILLPADPPPQPAKADDPAKKEEKKSGGKKKGGKKKEEGKD